jgi:prepilin-type N-terminal cleavage/methylation domain-containing protein
MDRDGFTLIELLVTLAIAGIVIGAITLFSSGPSASEQTAFVDNSLAAVRTLPNLARQRREQVGFTVSNNRLLTVGSAGVIQDGPSIQIPDGASVESTLQIGPDSVSGSLTLRISNSCTRITPLSYSSAEKTPC